jgi:hypothetical protein
LRQPDLNRNDHTGLLEKIRQDLIPERELMNLAIEVDKWTRSKE